ncbi:MAG: beta-glucosidase BglX, partial [Chitinophagales bacterium]|nr:beta-glucosidase BglX [Chitinophagales bacterium]
MKFFKSVFLASLFFLFGFSSDNSLPENNSLGKIFLREDGVKEKFITDLVNKMTVEEKIGQMVLFTSDWSVTGPTIRENYIEDIRAGKVGAVFNAYTTAYTRQLQTIAVEETRLGIPLMFGYDVIHGHRTIFPVPLAESCSWDLMAIERSARIAASEASAEGINWTFAPMVDISRDPRWGRISEGAGEDTYLGSLMASARVKGFQGDNYEKGNTVVACAKHYAAYGAAQSGRDYNSVDMSENQFRDTYLPPFKACMDAGVGTFMTSFNDLNGVPASGNGFLLKNILRTEWNFQGFVVTDYTSINEMVNHGFAVNDKEAGEIALHAGVDMDMQGAVYYNYLQQSLSENKITITQIDEAVKNILGIKYELGLFNDPYKFCNTTRETTEIMTPANLEAARDMARKSIVLLKNENDVLPLKRSGTIALIGPLADDQRNLIGNWSAAGDWKKSVSVLQGFKNKLGDDVRIIYAKGANITDDKNLLKKLNDHGGDISIDKKSPAELINEAVEVAGRADVVVMVLGESQGMSGEAASRSDIGIPENQKTLLQAIHATGKPVVLVLMNGRPL